MRLRVRAESASRNRLGAAPFAYQLSRGEFSIPIIGTIVIGFLAGVVAKFLTPGRDPGGFIITILLGIVGAFVATYLGQAVGWYRADEGAGFIGAVIGAIIVLLVYRLIAGRRTTAVR